MSGNIKLEASNLFEQIEIRMKNSVKVKKEYGTIKYYLNPGIMSGTQYIVWSPDVWTGIGCLFIPDSKSASIHLAHPADCNKKYICTCDRAE